MATPEKIAFQDFSLAGVSPIIVNQSGFGGGAWGLYDYGPVTDIVSHRHRVLSPKSEIGLSGAASKSAKRETDSASARGGNGMHCNPL